MNELEELGKVVLIIFGTTAGVMLGLVIGLVALNEYLKKRRKTDELRHR